jgi:hypothetical protein
MSLPGQARVSGPIKGARAPWGAPQPEDLTAHDYVCEEYQLEGTATAYDHGGDGRPPSDGRWAVTEAGVARYRTRMLVVRPRTPDRFNGTVLVNWTNVSAGFELARPASNELYRGYAWVGVSAQEVGLHGLPFGLGGRGRAATRPPLVDADPERYGELSHPGDPGSFDIFGQAAAAVGPEREAIVDATVDAAVDAAVDPMGGLPVHRLVATGASQSAMRLVAYANAVHLLHPVVDGFVLSVWEGRAPRLDEGPIGTGGVRTRIRADLGVPVLVVNSEFETTGTAAVTQPDTDLFRMWEVAGTAHAAARRGGDRSGEARWVPNPLSWAPVHEAALRQMHRWLIGDGPAPRQARIDVDPGPPPEIRRDPHGNALGGIRLPEMVAPVAAYRGIAFGTGRAPLYGGCRAFGADELRSLYPSREVFLEKWQGALDQLIRTGALLPEDAAAMRALPSGR